MAGAMTIVGFFRRLCHSVAFWLRPLGRPDHIFNGGALPRSIFYFPVNPYMLRTQSDL